jgi:hypothetical protein
MIFILGLIFLVIYLFYPFVISTPECLVPEYTFISTDKPGPTIALIGSVHGNEPAGSSTLINMEEYLRRSLKRGKLLLITKANPCGLKYNTRANPYSWNDINRQFYQGTSDQTAMKILELLYSPSQCDLILDFHEGWGWYAETKDNFPRSIPDGFNFDVSIGSTLSPSPKIYWDGIVQPIVDKLNKNIKDKKRCFSIRWNTECDTKGTLNCYAYENKTPYMLIETTGQNNIVPLRERVNQNADIIIMVLKHFAMI